MAKIYNINGLGKVFFKNCTDFLSTQSINAGIALTPTPQYAINLTSYFAPKNEVKVISITDLKQQFTLNKLKIISFIYSFLKAKISITWGEAEKIFSDLLINPHTINSTLLEALEEKLKYKDLLINNFCNTQLITIGILSFNSFEREFLIKTSQHPLGIIILHNIDDTSLQQKFLRSLNLPQETPIISVNPLPFTAPLNLNFFTKVYTLTEQTNIITKIIKTDTLAAVINQSNLVKRVEFTLSPSANYTSSLDKEFILLTLNYVINNYDFIDLLHLLKHPFIIAVEYEAVQELELKYLRNFNSKVSGKQTTLLLSIKAQTLLNRIESAFNLFSTNLNILSAHKSCIKALLPNREVLQAILETAHLYIISDNLDFKEYKYLLTLLLKETDAKTPTSSPWIVDERDILITSYKHLIFSQLLSTNHFINALFPTLGEVKISIIYNATDTPSTLLLLLQSKFKQSEYGRFKNNFSIAVSPLTLPSFSPFISSISVAMLMKLIRDPFIFYDECILKITKLPTLDSKSLKVELNKTLYKALSYIPRIIEDPCQLIEHLNNYIDEEITKKFSRFNQVKSFWSPKTNQIISKIINYLYAERAIEKQIDLSINYSIKLENVELIARCDRVEHNGEGSLTLINYFNNTSINHFSVILIKALIASKALQKPINKLVFYNPLRQQMQIIATPISKLEEIEEKIRGLLKKYFY